MLANRTSILLRGVARRIPSGGFSCRWVSEATPPPLPVVTPQASAPAPVLAPAPVPAVAADKHGLAKLCRACEMSQAIPFVEELKHLSGSSRPPGPEQLIDMMESMLGRIFNPREMANFMVSMGKLGFVASNPRHRELILKAVQQLCAHKSLTGINISMCLDGMLKTGLMLSDLPDAQRAALMAVIEQIATATGTKGLDPRNLSSVLRALAKLSDTVHGMAWAKLPESTQAALLGCVERSVDQVTDALPAVLTVNSLGLLGLQASKLTLAQQAAVAEMAMKGLNKQSPGVSTVLNCQHVSMTLLGLCKMNFKHAWLSSTFKMHLDSTLLHVLPQMDAHGKCNAIYALGLMSWPWFYISRALQAAIQRAAVDALSSSVPQNVSLTFYGLGLLSAPYRNLSPHLTDAMNKAVSRFAAQLTGIVEQNIANVFFGFARMEAVLPQLPRKDLEHLLVRLASRMSPRGQSMSNCLFSLASMDASWSDLSIDTIRAIVPTLESLMPTMSELELRYCMHGLNLMYFDFQRAPSSVAAKEERAQLMMKLLGAVLKRWASFDDAKAYSYRRSFHAELFFLWLSTLPEGKTMITRGLGKLPVFPKRRVHEVKPSPMHVALSQALPLALQKTHPDGQFSIVNHFHAFDGFFEMAIAIQRDGAPVAFLSLDGAASYIDDGDQPRRIDLLKDFMYNQHYPNAVVYHVRAAVVKENGAKAVADEVASLLLKGGA